MITSFVKPSPRNVTELLPSHDKKKDKKAVEATVEFCTPLFKLLTQEYQAMGVAIDRVNNNLQEASKSSQMENHRASERVWNQIDQHTETDVPIDEKLSRIFKAADNLQRLHFEVPQKIIVQYQAQLQQVHEDHDRIMGHVKQAFGLYFEAIQLNHQMNLKKKKMHNGKITKRKKMQNDKILKKKELKADLKKYQEKVREKNVKEKYAFRKKIVGECGKVAGGALLLLG